MRVYGNDATCHAVSVVLFWFFVKIFLLLNMDKEETNFNLWGEISDSELVIKAVKVEQKFEKQREKRRFEQLEEDDLQELVTSAEAKSI